MCEPKRRPWRTYCAKNPCCFGCDCNKEVLTAEAGPRLPGANAPTEISELVEQLGLDDTYIWLKQDWPVLDAAQRNAIAAEVTASGFKPNTKDVNIWVRAADIFEKHGLISLAATALDEAHALQQNDPKRPPGIALRLADSLRQLHYFRLAIISYADAAEVMTGADASDIQLAVQAAQMFDALAKKFDSSSNSIGESIAAAIAHIVARERSRSVDADTPRPRTRRTRSRRRNT